MAFNDIRQAIIDGLDSTYSQALLDVIPVTAVVRTSDTVVTITLPIVTTYDIPADDVITLTMPASAIVGGMPVIATPGIAIQAQGAAAALVGSASLTITATASMGTFLDYRLAILDGLVSDQDDAHGWNVEVANIPVTAVVRTSATVVTITLPALSAYDLFTAEAITLTMPAGVIVGGAPVVATPTVDVALDPVAWFEDVRQDILDGFVSAQGEAHGWNVEYLTIPVTAVARTSPTEVTITLPALPAYDITATETITDTIPGIALTGAAPIVATPTITVTADAAALVGTATLRITGASTLTTAIRLTGAATGRITTSSGLTTAIRMTGAATTTVTGTSTLTTAIPLVGAATVRVTTSGIMEPTGALMIGTASLTITASGVAETFIRMSGAASLAITPVAELFTGIRLIGQATGTATAASTLLTAIRFLGTANLTVTAQGTMVPLGSQLAGTATVSVTAASAMTSGTLFDGAATLTLVTTSTLSTAITMAGTAVLRITAAGVIPTFYPVPDAVVVVWADDVVLRVEPEECVVAA